MLDATLTAAGAVGAGWRSRVVDCHSGTKVGMAGKFKTIRFGVASGAAASAAGLSWGCPADARSWAAWRANKFQKPRAEVSASAPIRIFVSPVRGPRFLFVCRFLIHVIAPVNCGQSKRMIEITMAVNRRRRLRAHHDHRRHRRYGRRCACWVGWRERAERR